MGIVLSEPSEPSEPDTRAIAPDSRLEIRTARGRPRAGAIAVCAEIVAALLKSPRTASELSLAAGMRGKRDASSSWSERLKHWLSEFRCAGIVYVVDWRASPPGRWHATWHWSPVYAMQRELFGHPDAPEPAGLPPPELRIYPQGWGAAKKSSGSAEGRRSA